MVSLHDHLYTFLDLRQDSVWIASEIGIAYVERSHIYDHTAWDEWSLVYGTRSNSYN